MSYRTIKRALGETNIERKCRILFGICLGILIFGAFLWVDRIGEKLVIQTTNQTGQDYVKLTVVYLHWLRWETTDEGDNFILAMREELLTEDLRSSVMGLRPEDEVAWNQLNVPAPPEDEQEAQILEELREGWQAQLREFADSYQEDGNATDQAGIAMAASRADPVFRTLPRPSEGTYSYYQPIYWTKTCMGCHGPIVGALTTSDGATTFDESSQPFRVVKVILPYEATQNAIASTRAVLIAAAILTIFLAMVALYLIVRYVIVKPLKHLRDVSDEVSRGHTGLRANIHTNDEFEDLADAFNRMLRHLIEAQSELRNLNKDLDAKVDELAQVNMRLYEMNRLKSDFLANMSHELRTPLNSIIGFSEVLQGIDSLSDKQKRYAQNIQKSGRVLLEMINDILDLAKLEAGKMEVKPSEFRIDTVVTAQCDMVRSLSEEKNIDLAVEIPSDVPPIYQDQSKVQQILTNLLSNAIKFTPEGGRITVCVQRTPDDRLNMSVVDTGVGIPEEDRDVIFEKFRQSRAVLGDDGLTREYSGTGLGLSIVMELCKLLGGEISFVSELGKGSTFTVSLPWSLDTRPSLGNEMSRKLSELAKPSAEDFQSGPDVVDPVKAGGS